MPIDVIWWHGKLSGHEVYEDEWLLKRNCCNRSIWFEWHNKTTPSCPDRIWGPRVPLLKFQKLMDLEGEEVASLLSNPSTRHRSISIAIYLSGPATAKKRSKWWLWNRKTFRYGRWPVSYERKSQASKPHHNWKGWKGSAQLFTCLGFPLIRNRSPSISERFSAPPSSGRLLNENLWAGPKWTIRRASWKVHNMDTADGGGNRQISMSQYEILKWPRICYLFPTRPPAPQPPLDII